MCNVNKQIAFKMLAEMPERKKYQLAKALERNLYFTSARVLSLGTIHVYKEGWYLELQGTRCEFRVFAYDEDGEFRFIRKPSDSLLHKLYKETIYFNESDFDEF